MDGESAWAAWDRNSIPPAVETTLESTCTGCDSQGWRATLCIIDKNELLADASGVSMIKVELKECAHDHHPGQST